MRTSSWRTVGGTRPPPEPVEPAVRSAARRRRKPGGRGASLALWLITLPFLAIAVLRVLGIDGSGYLVAAMALTPYLVVGGAVLTLVGLVLRRKFLTVVVLLMVVSIAALLPPRWFSNDQPAVEGQRLRVLAASLDRGRADPRALLNLVRNNEVDVLVLPELNQSAVTALEQAGLSDVLPHRVFDPRPGQTGAGIASRHPLRQLAPMETTFAQPIVVVDLPSRQDVELVAVHTSPAESGAEVWRAELALLPSPTPDSRVRVLAGDFNATLDHAALRGVLDRGYSDAAEQTGGGFTPTWSGAPFWLPVTTDHVLFDPRCAINGYRAIDVPGSVHRAVFADLRLPY